MFLLGVDIGTTGAKAAVFTPEGEMMGYGFKEYGISLPKPGWAEQDAEHVFSIAKEVVRAACADIGKDVGALSLSVQGDAIIPLDAKGNPLGSAQLGMDYRAKEMLPSIEETMRAVELFRLTGMRPHPMNAFVKMLWYQKYNPALYEKTYKFATYADYILRQLGSDSYVIDYTMATRTMCMDVHQLEWSDVVLDAFSFEKGKLAKPVAPGEIVGELRQALADELGIRRGCKLVAGGHDQACAALGAGVIAPGVALDSHGTAEVLSAAFDQPILNDRMFASYYPCYAHTVAGKYFTFALNHTGGISLKWFAEQFEDEKMRRARETGASVYDALCEQLSAEPAPITFIPHFNGSGTPTCELSAKGTVFGLTLHTTRQDIAKSIIDALCCEMRLNMEMLRESGIPVNTLRCVGGGARSPITLQTKADCMGIPVVTLKNREAACMGAAILAGLAMSVYRGAAEAADAVVKEERVYVPERKRASLYEAAYEKYRYYYDISIKSYL